MCPEECVLIYPTGGEKMAPDCYFTVQNDRLFYVGTF